MKISINKILNVFLFIFIVCTCEKIFEIGYTLRGTVTEVIDNEEIPVSNIIIKLEGPKSDLDTTDSEGNFVFSSVSGGTYKISIKHSIYKSFDTTIVIEDHISIKISINSIEADFFPLKLGNIWTYNLYETHSWDGGFQNLKMYGKRLWKVVDIDTSLKSTSYLIENRLSGTIYKRTEIVWPPPGTTIRETTYIADDTTFFHISEENNEVQFDMFNYRNKRNHTEIMKRFNSLSMGDTLKILHFPGYSKYLRETGLIEYKLENVANYHFFTRMNLLEFNSKMP